MLFKIESVVLMALCASTYASPTGARDTADIEARMASGKPMVDVNCGGQEFTSAQIAASKTQAGKGQFGKYPEVFGNKPAVFGATKELWSFPLMDPVYSTGQPGKYRVVMDAKYNYVGSMYHPNALGGGFVKCT